MRHMTKALLIALLGWSLAGCFGSLNQDISVPAGTRADELDTVNGAIRIGSNAHAGDASTVNGSIELATGARAGALETVNGRVTLHRDAQAQSIETVNGGVRLAEGATVRGSIELVNGGIRMAAGAVVQGAVQNVNGDIHLQDAQVGQGIETWQGDIRILGQSVVDGGIVVQKADTIRKDEPPVIIIGPGATIHGDLLFKRPVQLFISSKATVDGSIEGAEAQQFHGDLPTLP